MARTGNNIFCLVVSFCFLGWCMNAADTNAPAWLTNPLTLTDAVDLALQRNAAILKAKSDLEAAAGVAVQTRAIAVPKVRATGGYTVTDKAAIDNIQVPG